MFYMKHFVLWPMHIVFIDRVPWPYRIDAPLTRPIGGTQSAVCYLMMALAACGVRVSFINNAEPHTHAGVTALGNTFPASAIQDADVFVHLNDSTVDYLLQLAAAAPKELKNTKKILWQHFAPDQPAAAPLADLPTLKTWDAVVFVSQWQERQYLKQFPALEETPRTILRNAISPAFENLFAELPVLSYKSPAPRLTYTSTPFRGLDRLMLAWPQVYVTHPTAELQIFSDMKLYEMENPEPLARLLQQASQTPGVTHVGAAAQPELAEALRAALILAYPNTFAETACIAVMEALAAGCIVVTSDLGALPETLDGHGYLIPWQADAHAHAADYAAQLSRIMTELKSQCQSGELEQRLSTQVQWANEVYTWATRAQEWEDWLNNFI